MAGTDPTNALSRLEMNTQSEGGGDGFVVQWPSVSNKYYTLYRSTNLTDGFSLRALSLRGAPPVNVYTDTVDGLERIYYRIKVEE